MVAEPSGSFSFIVFISSCRVDVPTAPLPGRQLKTSTHILPAKPISSGMKPAGKPSHFLPKISSYATSICSRRSIVESSKRMLKRRQSLSPPSSDDYDLAKSPLAPTCSGYTTSGAPLPSHSPPMGRLRKGSLAGSSGHRKNSDTSLKVCYTCTESCKSTSNWICMAVVVQLDLDMA